MNKKLLIISTFLTYLLQGCSPYSRFYMWHHDIIYYGTKEFEEFEKKANIKKEEAYKMAKEFAQGKQISPRNLSFVIDGKYVFADWYNPKLGTIYLFSAINVDSQTGETKLYSPKKYIPAPKTMWNGEKEVNLPY